MSYVSYIALNQLQTRLVLPPVTRGLDTLIKCSIQRDDDLKDILQANSGSLVVHSSCRKDYTRGSSIKSYKRKFKNGDDTDDYDNINPTKLRSRVGYPNFDFKVDCLFCTEPVKKVESTKTRITPRQVKLRWNI